MCHTCWYFHSRFGNNVQKRRMWYQPHYSLDFSSVLLFLQFLISNINESSYLWMFQGYTVGRLLWLYVPTSRRAANDPYKHVQYTVNEFLKPIVPRCAQNACWFKKQSHYFRCSKVVSNHVFQRSKISSSSLPVCRLARKQLRNIENSLSVYMYLSAAFSTSTRLILHQSKIKVSMHWTDQSNIDRHVQHMQKCGKPVTK